WAPGDHHRRHRQPNGTMARQKVAPDPPAHASALLLQGHADATARTRRLDGALRQTRRDVSQRGNHGLHHAGHQAPSAKAVRRAETEWLAELVALPESVRHSL